MAENTGLNPFQGQQTSTAMVTTQSSRENQEVQAMMIVAKKCPRNPIEAMERILNACTRPTLAEGAIYSYPRGGQNVEGPSIRLAEAMAQEWGNLQFGVRELSQENGESTVEAFAWDLEKNTRQVKVFQVPHKRFSKKHGTQILTDSRDIYELVANNGARRLRACILGVIPGDVTEAALKQCDETLKANTDVSPEGIKKLLDAFDKYGVTPEMIQSRFECRPEAIRPAQILTCKKIYTSLKDGMSKPQDWFAMKTEPTKSDLNEVIDNETKTA